MNINGMGTCKVIRAIMNLLKQLKITYASEYYVMTIKMKQSLNCESPSYTNYIKNGFIDMPNYPSVISFVDVTMK